MAKITKATLKSFITKAGSDLFVKVTSDFDPMSDGVRPVKGGFTPRTAVVANEGNLGISGVWLVGGSSNYFSAYNDGVFAGIEVCNCCGSFVVATKI